MKKLLMLVAVMLGTTVMVNAQEATKTAPSKDVKMVKHHKHVKVMKTSTEAGAKMEATKPEATKSASKPTKK